MEGLFLKLHNADNKDKTMRIGSFMIHDESTNSKRFGLITRQWHTVKPSEKLKLDGKAFRYMKCLHCGHDDFNEDSWDMNLYECNGCGQIIGATEHIPEKK